MSIGRWVSIAEAQWSYFIFPSPPEPQFFSVSSLKSKTYARNVIPEDQKETVGNPIATNRTLLSHKQPLCHPYIFLSSSFFSFTYACIHPFNKTWSGTLYVPYVAALEIEKEIRQCPAIMNLNLFITLTHHLFQIDVFHNFLKTIWSFSWPDSQSRGWIWTK